jgi:hypothetical protein
LAVVAFEPLAKYQVCFLLRAERSGPQAPDGIPKHRSVSQETLEPIHPRMYFVPSAVSGTDGYLTFHKTAYDQYAALSAAPLPATSNR